MKNAAQHLIAQCPPYLLFLTMLVAATAFGLAKLASILQAVQG